ncbi:hypothetical protein KPH14_012938, partial [Odynerus spinipes]
MDANAVSPMWYSKGEGAMREKEVRGRVLEEWIVVNNMIVLNEPCVWSTYAGMAGSSDIDVTLVNGRVAGWEYEWSVECDWGISDHNVILVCLKSTDRDVCDNNVCVRWKNVGVDWEEYERDLRESALVDGVNVYDDTNARSVVSQVTSLIQGANERNLGRVRRSNRRNVKWWTKELRELKRKVKRSRKRYQRARGRCDEMIEERKREYRRMEAKYKRELRIVKEENWRNYVKEVGNLDPWGPVYRLCMGKNVRQGLSGMNVNDRVTSTWKESVNVLLDRFFPAASVRMDEYVSGYNEDKCFEWEELDESVKMMKLGKAPGIDGVTVKML